MNNVPPMGAAFTGGRTFDVRFPTSAHAHGSDAMNVDPDYSASYLILYTDADDGLEGHGFAFTIGRGNEIQLAAIRALLPLVVGVSVEEVCSNMGAFARSLHGDSQLRWLGPDKGVMQMAIAAVLNAVWDLAAKRARKPLWRLLSALSPSQIVELVDFRYLSDVLTPQEAAAMLERNAGTRDERIAILEERGFPAYTTSAGWMGYDDAQLSAACKSAVADGWEQIKIKVGSDLEADARRCKIARSALGPTRRLMADANQRWSASEAIEACAKLAPFDLWWIEEPTHPDDVLAHARIAKAVAPVRVAAGEHLPNAIAFKQYFEAGASRVAQVDACRSGGVNDVIATLLLAAKFGIPVCPHAGGVGLCELAQHLSIFDYVVLGGSLEDRMLEFVDHLHEHFIDPVVIRRGRYTLPQAPGFSSAMLPESIERYAFPGGPVWRETVAP